MNHSLLPTVKIPRFAIAPRPTPQLRDALFGTVSRERRPPLHTLRLPTCPSAEAGHIEWVDRDFHERAVPLITTLFAAWHHEDLLRYVVTIDRAWDPKFSTEGRPLTHAHGNAFDINSTWNALGMQPAKLGETGHIPHDMFDIARKLGFWCGTDWLNPAHKHFELTKL